jgi:hypothetical protein
MFIERKCLRDAQSLHDDPTQAISEALFFVSILQDYFGGILQILIGRSYYFALFTFNSFEPECCLLHFLASL